MENSIFDSLSELFFNIPTLLLSALIFGFLALIGHVSDENKVDNEDK